MVEHQYTSFCLIENEILYAFLCLHKWDKTVDDPKKCIKNEKPPELPKQFKLRQVGIPSAQDINPDGLIDEDELNPIWRISDHWKEESPQKRIHVYIKILGK